MKSLAHHVQQRPIAGDIGEELRWMKAARHVAQLAQRYGRRELCRFAQPQCKGFWQTRKILKELVALEPGYSAESPPQSTGSECVQACHRGASDDATHRHLYIDPDRR